LPKYRHLYSQMRSWYIPSDMPHETHNWLLNYFLDLEMYSCMWKVCCLVHGTGVIFCHRIWWAFRADSTVSSFYTLIHLTGLGIYVVSLRILISFRTGFDTNLRDRQFSTISAVRLVTIALTSLTSTSAICRYIYLNTSENLRSRRKYKHIVDILLQSSILYSTSALMMTISDLLVTEQVETSTTAIVLSNYFGAFTNIMAVRILHFFL